MSTTSRASRRAAAVAAALATTVTGLALVTAPAHAVSGVFISEFHYDNDGADVDEFVEVTAPAGTDLGGYSVVLYNGSNGESYATYPLSGVVADQQDGWGTRVVAATGMQNGSPDGVALVNGSTVVEFFSYEGALTAANGPASGQSAVQLSVSEPSTTPIGQSLQRLRDGSWTGPAVGGRGTPNGFGADGEPTPLTATDPGDVQAVAGRPLDPFTLEATGGAGSYTWTATGLPTGVTVAPTTGEVSGTPTTDGTFTVTATVTDAEGAEDAVEFAIEVAPEGGYSIAQVQGTGAASPRAGQTVTTRGVVTAMYQDPYPAELGTYGGLDGMYIQTPGPDTEGASDALFVYGASSMPAGVAIGDSVVVTGPVSEFQGMTQITPGAGGVTELAESLGDVTPRAVAYPTTEAAREAREGELIAPTDKLTVTNSYSTNQYGEVGLATGDRPLVQPTEVHADDDLAGLNAVKADNAARGVVLDDGTSINYISVGQPQQDLPLPWLDADHAVRVGAAAVLRAPVILEYRNSTWKFQPTEPVLDLGTDVVTFEDTRAENLAPQPVGGDLRIATFNVLNYFNTTGEAYVANGAELDPPTHCTYYEDRDGTPIGNRRCGIATGDPDNPNDGSGPRGAATAASFERQQAKIVEAITTMDADVVGLEEVENSIKLPGETDRDDALAALVAALNDAAGSDDWAFVPSPAEALTADAVAQQDVIRSAFIYQKDAAQPVGESDILFDTTEFAQAREPLAQAFKARGTDDSDAFAVIVNHFKSKGDSDPKATGDNANSPDTGAFNGDRTRQATKLADFAEQFAAERGIAAVFLAGDFNSYTMEDPMQVLYGEGYEAIESDTEGEESYSFSGLSGSLDHVLGNPAAMSLVTGADVWDINASEAVAYQYSRYNYNVTQLFDATNPFAASDHNPEIVGLDLPDPGPVAPTVEAEDTQAVYSKAPVRIPVRVTADGAVPTGTVSVLDGDRVLGTAVLEDGAAVVTLPRKSLKRGTYTFTVTYSGDEEVAPGSTEVTVRVTDPEGN